MKKVLLINDTSNEAHIGSRAVVKHIHILCEKNNMNIIHTLTRAQVFEKEDEVPRLIEEADIILINGEGSLHHHPRIATQFFPAIMSIIPSDKKIVLANALWENMLYDGVEEHLKKIDLISVRESWSFREIITQRYPDNVFIIPDLIFYGINIPENIGYCDSVETSIRHYAQKQNNYFPLNYIDKGTYLQPKELTYPSISAYQNWLNSLSLFVTGRFHGVCLAIKTATPFLTFNSNSHKIEALLEDLNCKELIISSFKEVHIKKNQLLAQEAIPKLFDYKVTASEKIEAFYKKVGEL